MSCLPRMAMRVLVVVATVAEPALPPSLMEGMIAMVMGIDAADADSMQKGLASA